SSYYPAKATPEETGAPVLTIENGANERLRDISLTVRHGEVVGIAGLEGAGRTELARAIFGVEPFQTGTMALDGKVTRITRPQQAIRAGIGYLTEDRKAEGLVLPRNVRDNALLALRSIRRLLARQPAGGTGADLVTRARRVDLRASGLDQEVRFLSGGNQQKVVLMKWLATGARLFIFDEPTRGIDVGAKANIHELMRELARAGAGILMISSELPEVIGMSDRILVMRRGTIAGELGADPTEAEILRLATGEPVRELAA
ncbi:MAG: sugar ABC transporter ATP-binding protein, partial [Chloroflexia bacterium]|nr:sugar ABC transporter ATP-binding protein [Chloroflexia bacterium]